MTTYDPRVGELLLLAMIVGLMVYIILLRRHIVKLSRSLLKTLTIVELHGEAMDEMFNYVKDLDDGLRHLEYDSDREQKPAQSKAKQVN